MQAALWEAAEVTPARSHPCFRPRRGRELSASARLEATPLRGDFTTLKKIEKMKTFKYVFVAIAIAFAAAACTDENVKPLGEGEDDPIIVPPKPPKG